jgi:hypothetical protein
MSQSLTSMPTLTTLLVFNITDGDGPDGLIAAAGDLFGAMFLSRVGRTMLSGGTVFEIPKTGAGSTDAPTTLVTFHGTNGIRPHAGLIAAAAGNLFGTTGGGGSSFGSGAGTVFELSGTGFPVPAARPPSSDFIGNGHSELLFQNSSGEGYIWELNGGPTSSSRTAAAPWTSGK